MKNKQLQNNLDKLTLNDLIKTAKKNKCSIAGKGNGWIRLKDERSKD